MLKYIYYIKYFFYIAINWNLRLAAFSIFHEIRGERKYGINTSVLDDLKTLAVKGDHRDEAEIYQGASYYLLEKIFEQLRAFSAPDDLIDIGSGKGRVMVVAANFGFNRITGVEFAAALCTEAEMNCQVITQQFPNTKWKVVHANASDYQFGAADHVFFFFNPFKAGVMGDVLANIQQSLYKNPRRIFVVYMNPQHKKLFIREGFKELAYIRRMQYVDAVIYEKSL